ncbi:MAG: dihydrolipoyl dehydrogenase family protein [Gemmatimonadales bacterium]
MAQFDLVVLGTGAAGSAVAHRCRRAGWRVAVVDDQPYGGTCALRGCDPKKVLVGAAELVDWQRRMSGHGVVGDAQLDWRALIRFKRTFTDPVPARVKAAFGDAGIAAHHRRARFVAEHQLVVGDEMLDAEHVAIATGARPAPLGIPGEEHVRTSTDFLELDELPRRIVFIGAGYVSFEFAHIAQRAGASTVVIGRDAPLAHFDQDIVACLVEHSRSLGIDLRLQTTAIAVGRTGDAFHVRVDTPHGSEVLEADLVVHGAGRVPNTGTLDLAAGRVITDRRGAVVVNEFLQSVSNPRVYAAGDVAFPAGSMPLTPVGSHEGLVVASNLLRGNRAKPNYRGTPTVVFTVPPLASVGPTEADARAEGLPIRVKVQDTGSWYSNRRLREPAGIFKTIVEDGTDRVLGAHVFGPQAEEMINIFGLAVRHGLTATSLRHTIYAYPTRGSDVPYMI